MSTHVVIAFLAVAALAYVTPGPDWFVVLGRAADSRRDGLLAAAGVQAGLLVHLTAAALGVSALLLASAEAFTVVKLVGAAYLVYLGVRALWSSRPSRDVGPTPSTTTTSTRAFRTGFLGNVMNPKAALFFIAVLPQFVDRGDAVAPQVLALGLADVALGVLWWGLFVTAVRQVSRVAGGRAVRRVLDRVAGTALVTLGAALALTPARRVA